MREEKKAEEQEQMDPLETVKKGIEKELVIEKQNNHLSIQNQMKNQWK